MNLHIARMDGHCLVSIQEPRLDARNAVEFKELLVGEIQAGQRAMIVDFHEVDFIDSSGLGALVTSLKVMGKSGSIVLAGITDTVMPIFSMTQMDKVFRIHATVKDAEDALSA